MTAETTIQGDVAIIAMNNPPVNGLGYETRVGITNALEKANADPAIKAIVLTGAGKAFSGGADIREFNSVKAMQEPILLSVILAVEHSQKPVVAAVHSVAMGGGLELALGCHYRVGAPGCKVALPEVKLGLIPGAGGTVRLPRVLGVEAALNMIVSGEPVNSELLAQLPGQKLFDQLSKSPESLLDEAVALARQVAAKHADGSPLPLVRNLPCKHKDGDAYFQFARNMVKGMAKNFPAPLKCVDAVENATRMKFDDALAKEREIFINLMQTPECKALRHIFAASAPRPRFPMWGPKSSRATSRRCRHRRRHHGWRHRDELPQRRHSGDHPWRPSRKRWTAAWPPSARTTRHRSRRASSSRTSTSSAWPCSRPR